MNGRKHCVLIYLGSKEIFDRFFIKLLIVKQIIILTFAAVFKIMSNSLDRKQLNLCQKNKKKN